MMNKPFILKPAYQKYIWGGTRLAKDYEKIGADEPLAEAWECSVHPDGLSTIDSGEYSGRTLAEVLKEHPEYLSSRGDHPGLRILVKLINAEEPLSIQVHPADDYAELHEGGQLGKTEMWYILEAPEDGEIIFGLSHNQDSMTIEEAAREGSLDRYLNRVPVKKGDVFYIPAGTIHSIGAGIILAEVQESSNLTYRLYDYGRRDFNGEERPLHIEKAMDVADLSGTPAPRQPMRVLKYRPGIARESLARCPYFAVDRVLTKGDVRLMDTDGLSFHIIMVIEGSGALSWGEGGSEEGRLSVKKGRTVFIPAASYPINAGGELTLLDIRG